MLHPAGRILSRDMRSLTTATPRRFLQVDRKSRERSTAQTTIPRLVVGSAAVVQCSVRKVTSTALAKLLSVSKTEPSGRCPGSGSGEKLNVAVWRSKNTRFVLWLAFSASPVCIHLQSPDRRKIDVRRRRKEPGTEDPGCSVAHPMTAQRQVSGFLPGQRSEAPSVAYFCVLPDSRAGSHRAQNRTFFFFFSRRVRRHRGQPRKFEIPNRLRRMTMHISKRVGR